MLQAVGEACMAGWDDAKKAARDFVRNPLRAFGVLGLLLLFVYLTTFVSEKAKFNANPNSADKQEGSESKTWRETPLIEFFRESGEVQ